MFDVNLSKELTKVRVLSVCSKVTIAETEFGKIGMTVCYDVRFRIYTQN